MQVVPSPPRHQSPKPQIPKGRAPRGLGLFGARGGTLGLALAAGLAAALLAFLLVRGRVAVATAAPALVPVVVAARDIPARTRLSAAWLRVRQAAPADLPDGSVGTAAEMVGKVTTEPIRAGAAVTRHAVASPSAALGMAFALPPSLRAMTVTLDPADGADQFARPGDHVDILATDEPGSGPTEARTVLQNVRLLAVGTQTAPDAAPSAAATGPAHVTVAVLPAQAQALVLAAARGKIHLALRAVDDDAVASLPAFPAAPPVREPPRPTPPRARLHRTLAPAPVPVSEEALPLPPLPVHLPPPPPARVSVTIIKGSQSQTVSVEP
jgi:pilus assembly protein CpaB